MSSLKIGISGVRGIVGSSLTNAIVIDFGKAFSTFINCGKILVARDTRTSGDMLKNAVIAGILSSGCEVLDGGIIPTPTALFYARRQQKVEGGIIVTASHNPGEWNGLKFIDRDGTFLNEARLAKFFDVYYKKEFRTVPWEALKGVTRDTAAIDAHIDAVLKNLDVKAIRKKHFKIGVDYVNGAGCVITPRFLSELGCRVFPINDKPNGLFAHEPEPIPKNLKGLGRLVRHKRLDIGFAQDPDADRLAVISEKGETIGEELTLALAVKFVLRYRKKGIVVTNLSASSVIDYITNLFKVKLIRTKVGESNVVYEMKKKGALIGGEGNGGVIYPHINYGRDSLVGMGLILEYLAKSGKKVSGLVDELPRYEMIKGKYKCPFSKTSDVVEAIKSIYKKEKIDSLDGVKVIWQDKWIHIRPSNTEPIVRIITEARTRQEAGSLYADVSRNIEGIVKQRGGI
ncbi:MAG: phosphoglucosamine mutase [Candidatus Omnitrophica bacterium]|nr:phosphoglucosamine mutase [Candidatus Omnitrophota bacterium]